MPLQIWSPTPNILTHALLESPKQPSLKSNYTGAGIILRRYDDDDEIRYLLLRGSKTGIWSFPKGHKNPDESNPFVTALRETYEETGYHLGTDFYIDPSDPIFRSNKVHYWIGTLVTTAELRMAPLEHDLYGWFTLQEMPTLRINCGVRDWIKKQKCRKNDV